MRRDEVIRLIRSRREELDRYAVKSIALFGSVARDEEREGSDVDVLVDFASAPTFDAYMGLKFFLEDLLGVEVDVVTPTSLRPRIRDVVLREAVHVA